NQFGPSLVFKLALILPRAGPRDREIKGELLRFLASEWQIEMFMSRSRRCNSPVPGERRERARIDYGPYRRLRGRYCRHWDVRRLSRGERSQAILEQSLCGRGVDHAVQRRRA